MELAASNPHSCHTTRRGSLSFLSPTNFVSGCPSKGLGYEVFEAATGPEAIDKASSMRPDLIMMDPRLPGMNGDEATIRLKRNLSTRNIPVVISTAWTTV
jgi:DNA-binding NarL/FixJ family response regulator